MFKSGLIFDKASQSGVSLPEYYFRVSREEEGSRPGRYFSHIDRIPWEEM